MLKNPKQVLADKDASPLLCWFVVGVEVAVVTMMVVVAVVWMQKNVNIRSCSFPNVKNTQNIKFPRIKRMRFRRTDGPTDGRTDGRTDRLTNGQTNPQLELLERI